MPCSRSRSTRRGSPRARWIRGLVAGLLVGSLVALGPAGCGPAGPSDEGGQGGPGDGGPDAARVAGAALPQVLHLVEVFEPHMASEAPAPPEPPRSERGATWHFDGNAPEPARPSADAPPLELDPELPASAPERQGWRALQDVADLSAAGLLRGRSTGPLPLLHASWEPPRPDEEVVALIVAVRASAGAGFAAAFDGQRTLDLPRMLAALEAFGWPLSAPHLPGSPPGEHTRRYVLRPPYALRAGDARQLLLRPTDVAGAEFAIESVRIVTRQDVLARLPGGASREGLGEIWCESLLARAPQTLALPVRLPTRPTLFLELGTPATTPLEFVVRVRDEDGAHEVLSERVVRRDVWHSRRVALDAWAGRAVQLELSLVADAPGTPGFWGAPVVRQRLPASAAAAEPAAAPESRTGTSAGAGRAGSRPPNVLLIVADTLRADRLEAYGHGRPTAPHVAALADRGVRFDDASAQATWTKASMPSLLTGLFPATHGVVGFDDALPASAGCLAEALRAAGWATLQHSSVLFTGRFSGLEQGFEVLHEAASLRSGSSGKTAREHVERLLPWLERHRDVPWFALLHVFDPHDPYRALPPHDGAFADLERHAEHEALRERARPFISEDLRRTFAQPTRDELLAAGVDAEAFAAYERDLYDGSIRGMDAELGRVLEQLGALGILDDTLVVFTSDHGEEFLERGRPGHGQGVHVELSRVPLIVAGPGVPAGVTVPAPVMSVDVLPTVLELAGVASDAPRQGRSLVPWLRGAADPAVWAQRPVVTERAALEDPLTPPPLGRGALALRLGPWRLVQQLDAQGTEGARELYDLRADPREQVDLAARHPDVVQRLHAALVDWRAQVARQRLAPTGQAGPEAGPEQPLGGHDAEALRTLEALGYVR